MLDAVCVHGLSLNMSRLKKKTEKKEKILSEVNNWMENDNQGKKKKKKKRYHGMTSMPSLVGTTLGAKGVLHILMYTNPNPFSSFHMPLPSVLLNT